MALSATDCEKAAGEKASRRAQVIVSFIVLNCGEKGTGCFGLGDAWVGLFWEKGLGEGKFYDMESLPLPVNSGKMQYERRPVFSGVHSISR